MSPEAPPALMLLGSLEARSVQAGFGREVSLLLMLYREEVFFFFFESGPFFKETKREKAGIK